MLYTNMNLIKRLMGCIDDQTTLHYMQILLKKFTEIIHEFRFRRRGHWCSSCK